MPLQRIKAAAFPFILLPICIMRSHMKVTNAMSLLNKPETWSLHIRCHYCGYNKLAHCVKKKIKPCNDKKKKKKHSFAFKLQSSSKALHLLYPLLKQMMNGSFC